MPDGTRRLGGCRPDGDRTEDRCPQRDAVGPRGEQLGSGNGQPETRRWPERILRRKRSRERGRPRGGTRVSAALGEYEEDCDGADEANQRNDVDTTPRQPVNRGSSWDWVLGVATMKPVEATSRCVSFMDFGSSSALVAGGAPAR